MARIIISDRLAARGANLVLGCELNNYDSYHIQLPSAQFLQAHGLNTVRDPDLTAYPTNLSMIFALERFEKQNCISLERMQFLTSVMIEEDAREYLAGLSG